MAQYSLQNRLTKKWAKEVDVQSLKILSWTNEKAERWVSALPLAINASKASDAPIEEQAEVVHQRRADWKTQSSNLLKLAAVSNCHLIAVDYSDG
jgi:hypothetical protein